MCCATFQKLKLGKPHACCIYIWTFSSVLKFQFLLLFTFFVVVFVNGVYMLAVADLQHCADFEM